MLTLDLIIATLGPEGIRRVASMLLPPMDGVSYIISWQRSDGVDVPPAIASRTDVTLLRDDGIGLSRNRNNALNHSTADIRLIADDDLIYTSEQLRDVIATFESNPGLDVACFRYDGADSKVYPDRECPLFPVPKYYFPTSFEMALRNRGEAAALRYDERFGLGSALFPLGEEEELLYRIGRLRLDARFFPVTITTHPGHTTGLRPVTDPRALRGQGATIALFYPRTWILRVPLKAWRNSRAGLAPFFRTLVNAFRGALWSRFRY